MESRTVRILFLRSTPTDHWMNRLVASLDPPFCHVEIDFDVPCHATQKNTLNLSFITDQNHRTCAQSTSRSMASSIYSGEKLFFKPRRFASPNYMVVTLTVDTRNFNRMVKYCRERSDEGVEFDEIGMYLSYFSCCILDYCRNKGNKTFCSEHVTKVLQIGGVTETQNLNPSKTSPSRLYKTLSTSNKTCIGSVPYKVNLMENMELVSTSLVLPQKPTICGPEMNIK